MTEFTLSSKLGKGITYSVEGVGVGVDGRDDEYVKIDDRTFSLSDLLRSAGMEVSSEWAAEKDEAKKYHIKITIEAEPL